MYFCVLTFTFWPFALIASYEKKSLFIKNRVTTLRKCCVSFLGRLYEWAHIPPELFMGSWNEGLQFSV